MSEGKSIAKKFEKPAREDKRSPLDRASGFDVTWENVQPLFEAAKRLELPSFVYLIGEEGGGPVKIGVAKDPIKRLWGMRTGNPRHLLIEHVIVGDIRAEQLLHEMWEPLGIRSKKNRNRTDTRPGTEWFAPEIRKRLFPVIAEIAEAQAYLLQESKEPDELSLIHEAHRLHGIEPHYREKVLTLAQNGYHESKT